MPIREYKCLNCNEVFETYEIKSSDKADPSCPGCGNTNIDRLVSNTHFRLVGKDWTNPAKSDKGVDGKKARRK